MSLLSIVQQYQEKYQPVLESVFSAFLSRTGASKITVKNYLADLRNFLSWLFATLAESSVTRDITGPQSLLRTVTPEVVDSYKRSAILAKTPVATINRRLTTLRTFFQCAVIEGWVTDNPTIGLQNIPNSVKSLSDASINTLLADYMTQMQRENRWVPTDDSDLREFLTWYREQLMT